MKGRSGRRLAAALAALLLFAPLPSASRAEPDEAAVTEAPQASAPTERAEANTPLPQSVAQDTTSTPAPTSVPDAMPTEAPAPSIEPTPVPDPTNPSTEAPTATPDPQATPEVSATPTESPSPSPTAEPTPAPSPDGIVLLDPSEDWSDNHLDAARLKLPEDGLPIPLLFQYNYKTAVCTFNGESKSTATSGCGATAASMVIAYTRQNYDQTPYTLFYEAAANGWYRGSGLDYETIQRLLSENGVDARKQSVSRDAIVNALESGRPVILKMGPGEFTDNGHYIVLRGLDADGRVLVNDPNSESRSGNSYSVKQLLSEVKSDRMLVVYTKGKGASVKATPEPEASATPEPEASMTPVAEAETAAPEASATPAPEASATSVAEAETTAPSETSTTPAPESSALTSGLETMPVAIDEPK